MRSFATIHRRHLCPVVVTGALIFLSAGCGEVPMIERALPLPTTNSTVTLRSPGDSLWSLLVPVIQLSDTALDVTCDTTESLAAVQIRTPETKTSHLKVMTIPDGKIRSSFQIPASARVIRITDSTLQIMEPGRTVEINGQSRTRDVVVLAGLDSGNVRYSIPANWVRSFGIIAADREGLTVTSHQTGAPIWSKLGPDVKPTLPFGWSSPQGSMFWIHEGLWCARMESRKMWHYDVPLSQSKTAAAIVMTLLRHNNYVGPGGEYFKHSTSYFLFSNPLETGGNVYFSFSDSLACLDAASGKPRWVCQVSTTPSYGYLDTLDSQTGVYVGYGRDFYNGEWTAIDSALVCAFDLRTGRSLWRISPLQDEMILEARVENGRTSLRSDSAVVVIDKDGRQVGVVPLQPAVREWTFGWLDSTLMLSRPWNQQAWRFDEGKGPVLVWKRKVGLLEGFPQRIDNHMWVAGIKDTIHALDPATGAVLRSVLFPFSSFEARVDKDGVLARYSIVQTKNSIGFLEVRKLVTGLP